MHTPRVRGDGGDLAMDGGCWPYHTPAQMNLTFFTLDTNIQRPGHALRCVRNGHTSAENMAEDPAVAENGAPEDPVADVIECIQALPSAPHASLMMASSDKSQGSSPPLVHFALLLRLSKMPSPI